MSKDAVRYVVSTVVGRFEWDEKASAYLPTGIPEKVPLGSFSSIKEAHDCRRNLHGNVPAPPVDAVAKCLVCGLVKPWGIWAPQGVAVCVECRDKARA